jgi:uncharacterized protein YPO0396
MAAYPYSLGPFLLRVKPQHTPEEIQNRTEELNQYLKCVSFNRARFQALTSLTASTEDSIPDFDSVGQKAMFALTQYIFFNSQTWLSEDGERVCYMPDLAKLLGVSEIKAFFYSKKSDGEAWVHVKPYAINIVCEK